MELVTTQYIFVGIYCTKLHARCKEKSRKIDKNFMIYFLFYIILITTNKMQPFLITYF